MAFEPSEMFKVLGVETRVRIIEILKSKGPVGVNAIAKTLGITPAAVSQHLKILKHAGLVQNERKGYWIPYSINVVALDNCRCMLDKVCACGCEEGEEGHKPGSGKEDLNALVEHEKELEKKLETVRERISKIRTEKK
jgi:ArsR family transcriptional regulator